MALSFGFKHNGIKFLPIFKQTFPFLMLHYYEKANSDKMIYWSMVEWLSSYISCIVKEDPKELTNEIKMILFDLYRTFFPSVHPAVNLAKFNLMKSIFQCPQLANSYLCLRNQENKIIRKITDDKPSKKCYLKDTEIAELETCELFINTVENIDISPLELSFLLLHKLNNLNYQLSLGNEIKDKLKILYQRLQKILIANKKISIEEILYFYQSALVPNQGTSGGGGGRNDDSKFGGGNEIGGDSGGIKPQKSSGGQKGLSKDVSNKDPDNIYKFSKPIVIETQDFINNTFEKLLRKIDVNPLSSSEIIEYSNSVYPFIFRIASSSTKSYREHGIPMLLYVSKKLIKFSEKGEYLDTKFTDGQSLVQNFSPQIQAILKYNLEGEWNNQSPTMKKIFEIVYL